jgi:hypothetical protein
MRRFIRSLRSAFSHKLISMLTMCVIALRVAPDTVSHNAHHQVFTRAADKSRNGNVGPLRH